VKALKWLRQGATPTERVEKLLKKSGAWGEYRPGEAPAAPAAAAPAVATPAAAPAEAK
jgi:ribosomal protein S16